MGGARWPVTARGGIDGPGKLTRPTKPEPIVLIGCGSIGLPFAVALAKAGCEVEAFDIDKVRLAALAEGLEPLQEAELATALAEVIASKQLKFVGRINRSETNRFFVLAVPTPWSTNTGFDDSYLSSALNLVARVMRDGDALLVRSTTPVGVTGKLAARLAAEGLRVDVAAIPDRTVEGRSFSEEFSVPHLAGGTTPRATARAVALLERLGTAVALDNAESAEAAKLFSNAARHVQFSLANEMALICEELGLDVHHVLNAASRGYGRFQAPRPGPVGGPCLTKDMGILTALIRPATARIFNAAQSVNSQILEKVVRAVSGHLPSDGAKVAILGVAFKGRPAVNDPRGSFASAIAERLRADHPSITLNAWDPVMTADQIALLSLEPSPNAVEAARGSDAVIFTNDHQALAALDRSAIGQACRHPALIYNLTGSTFPADSGFGAGVTLRTLGVG